MIYPIKNTEKVLEIITFFVFAFFFYAAEQYVVSLFSLTLIVIFMRISDLKILSVNQKGILAEFKARDRSLSEIIRSNEPLGEKVDKSQKLIDQVFKLGYVAGGGNKSASIWDVKVKRDKNGNIETYEYSEN